MGKKSNLNKAMYDMFGVGSAPDKEGAQTAEVALAVKAAPVEEPVSGEMTAAPVEAVSTPYVMVPATYLAPGTVVEGTIRSKGDVEIAGAFTGDIIAEGDVTLHNSITANVEAGNLTLVSCTLTGNAKVNSFMRIGADSSINGDIVAAEVQCDGGVKGNFTVSGNIILNSGAVIQGNISASTMTMERGVSVAGELSISK